MALSVLDKIRQRALEAASAIALKRDQYAMNYRELDAAISDWAEILEGRVLGLMVDNGPAWIILDLAARKSGMTCVPLPLFFSDAQLQHIIGAAGVDYLITDNPDRIDQHLAGHALPIGTLADTDLYRFGLPHRVPNNYGNAAKVTFTSGTTGTPKGVCLQAETIDRVAHAMSEAAEATAADCMLSLLPLSTLLENIAVYAGLMAGGCIYLPSLALTGISMTGIDARKLCTLLSIYEPNIIVIVPEIFRVLIAALDGQWQKPEALRFIAVGGAPVSTFLLERAATLGLPVYQGYGLSEAASVACLNKPGANRVGSVGKPLPHLQIKISDEGEVLVQGDLFNGYLDGPANDSSILATGDLGYLDEDGYLYLQGRIKNIIVTSYGRNISPEWVESELTAEPAILQAVVIGDSRPFNIALLTPVAGVPADSISSAVDRANKRLPGYAQIKKFYILQRPLSLSAGEVTANGRMRRSTIEKNYQEQVEQLYMENNYALL